MRQDAVIFDMDGTLADCSHRLHFVERQGKKDWTSFFARCEADTPRPEVLRLAQELSLKSKILIASGRPERLRKVTETWLKNYEVPFARIYLRENDDRRGDGIVKSEMLEQMKAHGFHPWLVVDDRQTAVDAWRDLGLLCLQCDEGRY